MMTQEELDLIHGYLNGTLQTDDFSRLQSLLRNRADARRVLRGLATVDAKLHQIAAANTATLRLFDSPPEIPAVRFAWFSRRAAAAVAGLLIGLFCATVVFAYITPGIHKPVSIYETGFEDLAPPEALGVPAESGKWGGDFSEIVGAQQGVTPRSGAKMWRFLRADNALVPTAHANYVGEAIRVLDLIGLRDAGYRGELRLEISAWFAQGATAPDACYHWNIKAAAFEGNVKEAPSLWGKWDDLSASLTRYETKAQSAAQWQPLSVTMSVPASATFLVFECAVVQRIPRVVEGVAEFPSHYLDDVRVRLLTPDHALSR